TLFRSERDGGIFLQPVRQGNRAGEPPVGGHVDHGAAALLLFGCPAGRRLIDDDAALGQQPLTADQDLLSLHVRDDAAPRFRGEGLSLREDEPAGGGRIDDGLAKRVLGGTLRGRRQG